MNINEQKVQFNFHKEYVFPADLIKCLKSDKAVCENYQNFSEPYKQIRIAYIVSARKIPDEFEKRLNNFIDKTKKIKRLKDLVELTNIIENKICTVTSIIILGLGQQTIWC